ncbi:hypothetical protein NIES2101_36265 [Calothrix sp. HK-06]|nr:hypothetical protein NIES2101_36265 [Calothrix sp. HK-06]
MTFAVCGIFLSIVSIKAEDSSVLAQKVKLTTPPLVIAQRGDTIELRAESGPDDKGRWRFYQPSNVSDDAMQAQGCTNVHAGDASWRCRNRKIRVQVNNFNPNRPNYNYGGSTRELRAESGPDDQGRWRFYRPYDVSEDAMQAQGCTDVHAGYASWRCRNQKIRVQVNDPNRPNSPNYNYGGSTRELRAESGPDNQGRWRFYKPNDVSEDAMQAQGCTNVHAGDASWRCRNQKIRVQVNNSNVPNYNYGGSTRELRAESGPDDQGRWRFYKPNDVSWDAMQAQGCRFVGGGSVSWRCPRDKVRVQVDEKR